MINELRLNFEEEKYCNVSFTNLIAMLKEAYQDNEMIIKEAQAGHNECGYTKYKNARYTVDHFKFAYERLEPNERMIIENEFFKTPRNKKWYSEYFGKNTYYVTRKRAYYKFLDYLKG